MMGERPQGPFPSRSDPSSGGRMAKKAAGLTARQIQAMKQPGMHADGGG